MDYLELFIGIVVGFIVARLVFCGSRKKSGGESELIDRQTREKQEKKQKLIGMLQVQSKVSNSDVQKLLDVSDATATRYLDELEEEGLVRQVGEAGHQVYYEKIEK